jgi:AcrR family transcriptional regulator
VATTTRAVYSLFGSRDGLIAALGAHTYDLLRTTLEQLPQTADPQADMVEAGLMFRRFALEHPALFSIGIQRTLTSSELWPQFRAAADDALAVLSRRLARLQDGALLAGRTVREATTQFHALCEGLAALELRGALATSDAESIWRDALTALIAGFAITPPRQRLDPTITGQRPTK